MYEKKEMKKGRGFNSLHEAMSERFGSGDDPFFDFSNRRFEPREEKVRVVYESPQPVYARPARQPYPVRTVYRTRPARQPNMIQDAQRVAKSINRFAKKKSTKQAVKRIKKGSRELAQQTSSTAKKAFWFIKRKTQGIYGNKKKVSLPKANLPSDANEKM